MLTSVDHCHHRARGNIWLMKRPRYMRACMGKFHCRTGWKVAMKPGKPLMVARRGQQWILGLPGNPVASYVTAYFFLLPLMRALLGAQNCLPRTITAPLSSGLDAIGTRREFIRGNWDGTQVYPEPMRDSSALAALAGSNCLIDRPAHAPLAPAGTGVAIYLLENGGIY